MNYQIEIQLVEINTNKRMLECLELRLKMIRDGWANKSAYERNEVEILEIVTISQIDKIKVIIAEKELLLRETFSEFVQEQELICQ